jgi:ABC-type tungstate transport system substrate-binding protein
VVREATTMVLYVSVVEIAELAALPESHLAHGRVTGPVGPQLLEIVWGTAVGLALAHWFAFRLAAPAFRGERPTSLDTQIGFAQVGAAIFVAAVASVPGLLFSDTLAQETTGDVPALLVGVVAYLLARHTGTSRWASLFYGLTALALGVLVALVKSTLAAH